MQNIHPGTQSSTDKVRMPAHKVAMMQSGTKATVALDKNSMPPDVRPLSLNITLTPAPPPKVEWHENVTIWVAGIGLIGVILTVGLGYWRMRKELGQALTLANDTRVYSGDQADKDRTLASEQANQERKHSADEAHLERIATSRRSVYLDALRDVVRAHAFLGGLPNQQPTEIDYNKGLTELSIAVAQIAILGEMKTVLKSREVLSCLNQLFLKAMIRIIPIASARNDIKAHSNALDAANAKVKISEDQLTEFARKNIHSKDSAQVAGAHRAALNNALEHSSAIVAVHKTLSEHQMSYFDFMLSEIGEINKYNDELIVMIRSELGLTTDSAALVESTRAMQAEAKQIMEKLVDLIENS